MGGAPVVMEQLRLGAYEGDVGALVWIAQEKGFFTKLGLNADIKGFASGKAAMEAMQAGQVDVATAAEFVFATLSLTDDRLRILGNICHYRNKAMLGRRDRGIAVPKDLQGKRVGVTMPSGAEYSLHVFLAQQGLTIRDITLVGLSPKDLVNAIVAGSIDAALTWQPHVQTIENKLGKGVVTLPGEAYDQFLLLITHQEVAVAKESALRKLLGGLLLAEDWVLKHPEDARRLIATRFKLDPGYVATLWPNMRLTMNFPQDLMTALDGEASWLLKQNARSGKSGIPNYQTFILPGLLKAVNPAAVTVFSQ